jgi:hypothetical protein
MADMAYIAATWCCCNDIAECTAWTEIAELTAWTESCELCNGLLGAAMAIGQQPVLVSLGNAAAGTGF